MESWVASTIVCRANPSQEHCCTSRGVKWVNSMASSIEYAVHIDIHILLFKTQRYRRKREKVPPSNAPLTESSTTNPLVYLFNTITQLAPLQKPGLSKSTSCSDGCNGLSASASGTARIRTGPLWNQPSVIESPWVPFSATSKLLYRLVKMSTEAFHRQTSLNPTLGPTSSTE